jgi:hypothetical protein
MIDVRRFVDPSRVRWLAENLGSVDGCVVYVWGLKYIPQIFERWQYPDQTVERGGGDCEDLAILLCSLLRALGVKAYVRIAEFKSGVHAFNVFYYGGWWVFDASIKRVVTVYPDYKTIMDFNDSEIYVYDGKKYLDIVSRIGV